MLEYNIRTDSDKVEELQKAIKDLAVFTEKEGFTSNHIQRRIEEKAFLGLDNLDETVARLAKETLVEKIDKMNNSDNANLDDIGIERNVRNELINESRFPEGYSNEIILYAVKNNYSALYEEIGDQIDETYDSEMINEELSEIYSLGIKTMITDNYNLSYPNNYNNEIIFSAIVNNPSVLMDEMKEFNDKIDQVESKDVNEVLQELYTAGIEVMIKDVANELKLKEEELKVSDLMLIYNKIETDIEHEKPSFSKETIEEQIKIEKEIEKQENEREY